tara:strand:+ start:395 stop:1174 length:780 start_codon:yes stop_codon:yes gene_type:complete
MISETKQYKPVKNLLSKGSTNSKTAKNDIKTFILYLAPHNLNVKGLTLCKDASKGCIESCLYSAGRGAFSNVQNSRINKANFFVTDKKVFLAQLLKEIKKEIKKASDKNEKIAFRLNGTSDIDFLYLLDKHFGFNVDLLAYGGIYFYDYTKSLARAKRYKDFRNYTLTFSKSESNLLEVNQSVQLGINTAVVFSGKLPQTYLGRKVIDGDKSDLEMIKFKNIVLGLKAKGLAKKDKSGFVVNSDNAIMESAVFSFGSSN